MLAVLIVKQQKWEKNGGKKNGKTFWIKIIDSRYAKQHRCEIFVAEIRENEIEVQSTETVIRKRFRCYAPFELVLIDCYKYYATLLLCVASVIEIKKPPERYKWLRQRNEILYFN